MVYHVSEHFQNGLRSLQSAGVRRPWENDVNMSNSDRAEHLVRQHQYFELSVRSDFSDLIRGDALSLRSRSYFRIDEAEL
jgi:hypothetical protein